MLAEHGAVDRVLALEPVADASDVRAAQDAAARVTAAPALREYLSRLLWHTREDPLTALGASPRAGLQLLRAAKAHALLAGRDHVLPDDVKLLAGSVLTHRLVLGPGEPPELAEAVVDSACASVFAL